MFKCSVKDVGFVLKHISGMFPSCITGNSISTKQSPTPLFLWLLVTIVIILMFYFFNVASRDEFFHCYVSFAHVWFIKKVMDTQEDLVLETEFLSTILVNEWFCNELLVPVACLHILLYFVRLHSHEKWDHFNS